MASQQRLRCSSWGCLRTFQPHFSRFCPSYIYRHPLQPTSVIWTGVRVGHLVTTSFRSSSTTNPHASSILIHLPLFVFFPRFFEYICLTSLVARSTRSMTSFFPLSKMRSRQGLHSILHQVLPWRLECACDRPQGSEATQLISILSCSCDRPRGWKLHNSHRSYLVNTMSVSQCFELC
ncbi:hypothetical protein M404DRAFT_512834 [Pisolithus tinctorius Marx 270]|uniref:Uncharacterized protein n=1 Tax=Pisolithus tinctorius Marx 270 TaxID=870435 RepID=A0A0C3PCX9_PISTI|nr:hypothetical protein M404DRAFT_512834 [Pisolithus tinctorius Marx 270]